MARYVHVNKCNFFGRAGLRPPYVASLERDERQDRGSRPTSAHQNTVVGHGSYPLAVTLFPAPSRLVIERLVRNWEFWRRYF